MDSAPKLGNSREHASPTVLALAGMALNATVFPLLEHHTVTPDFSRFVPAAADGKGMRPYIEALDAHLDRSEWTAALRRIVVAHSFGGMLALAWWLQHQGRGPARIDGLVLISTTAGPMFDSVRVRPFGIGPDWRIPVSPFMGLWNSRPVTAMAQWILGRGVTPQSVDFRRYAGRGELAVGIAGWRNTAWRARRAFRTAMAGFDVRAQIPDVDIPCLVLHGDRDRLFPLARAEELVRGLGNAELRVVPGGGHILPLSHPQVVSRAIEDLT